jgi:hypothetical protein
VSQVWRGGGRRQANLARLLPALDVIPVDAELGRRAGLILSKTRTADVIDAAVALLARDGDAVLTFRHGRTQAEKDRERAERERAERAIEGKRLERDSDEATTPAVPSEEPDDR